ncbi:pre-rRNA 2'-O-ribose RNA methyltransferase FTSJ3 [Toxorhynchites rutilus septentrionalis]|uniref:pre-rRNA 2'-O-ribose RNA methyltransferase FTSJ3 n=1 Tax=Toxorhynchites rutilus septentrionalis TaxID=329112 RepID=UPI00247833E8|nr:pre-rRNA 2'-O-ribose RNA methyltransferase FTSJ3 [Toxorhynchites rutilus septentrionalis]
MGKKTKVGKDRRDKFYKLAKETGYRSRAAFKLIQLNRRFGFLQKSQVCIDLCAAPGGWMQVAKQNMPVSSIVIGVDLYPIKSVPGCLSLVGDITSDKTKSDLAKELKTWKADVVLNDGAPNVGRNWLFDAYQQVCLTLSAVKLATQFLKPGGWFVTKVFRSKDYNALIWVLKQLFKKVHATKPSASRNESAEIFVVCQYYRAPDKIDPRFLDAKYVFEELDVEPQVKVNLLKEVDKAKKAKVEGYDGIDVRKIIGATEFLQDDKPLLLLGRITEIQFDDDKIKHHPRTTPEIRECCKDIKVLGRKDLKDLLKWHKLLSGELFPQAPEEKDVEGSNDRKGQKSSGQVEQEEMDEADEETVELKNLEKQIAELQKEEGQDARRKRKKANKERTKLNEKLSLKMVIKGDEGPTEDMDAMLFSLNVVKNKKEINTLLDAPPDVLAEPGFGDDGDERPKKKQKYVKYDRETKGDLYEDEKILAQKSDDEDSDADLDRTGLGLHEPETMRVDDGVADLEEADSDDPEGTNPLITDLDYRDKDEKRRQKAQLWFEKDAFKNVLGEEDQALDYDLDRLTEMYKKAGTKIIGEDKNEDRPLGRKASRRAKHDISKGDSSSDDSDSEAEVDDQTFAHKTVEKIGGKDGFEVVSSEKRPKQVKLNEEELALGQLLISGKKTRRDLVDAAYNRYMFNDSNLPEWFVKDEEKTMKREAPVPHETVSAYKKNLEEVNVRSIKKVMEAKARKKKHATKRLEKIKKKAETIMENVDNTNQEKIRLLKKIYKKADPKKKDIAYVVAKKSGVSGKKVRRPKGVEGRFKVVDPRMKKDRRAEVAKTKRTVKRGGKPKPKGGKPKRK